MAGLPLTNVQQPLQAPVPAFQASVPAQGQAQVRRTLHPYAPSMSTAGALFRSRSRGDESISETSDSRIELLLMQQAALLKQQNELLTAQTLTHACGEYISPDTLVNKLEPGARDIARSWMSEYKGLVKLHLTQQELSVKYANIPTGPGSFMAQFREEAKRSWQWTKHYLAEAKPISHVDIDFIKKQEAHLNNMTDQQANENDSDAPVYKVDEAWREMRERHARECQNFVLAHQEAQASLIANKVTAEAANTSLQAHLNLWLSQNRDVQTSHSSQLLLAQGTRLAELLARSELPKVKSRLAKEAERRKKQQD